MLCVSSRNGSGGRALAPGSKCLEFKSLSAKGQVKSVVIMISVSEINESSWDLLDEMCLKSKCDMDPEFGFAK